MALTNNGSPALTRYYLGGVYEIDHTSSVVKEKLYLGGDGYTAPAVYLREGTGNWNIYYLCRDYLGSITYIATSSGSVVQELSYDAWGRLRNPVTQQAYAPDNEPALFLGRGYTGHEHLPWFGLINMNARLYDPALGRFLSPDPFVQMPDFSQNFNRYSYCLNNPLKYTDPDGEVLASLLGIVSGFIKGVGKVVKGENFFNIFTSTWKGFTNGVKIDLAPFNGNIHQIVSHFTKELPQTIAGYIWSTYRIAIGNVDEVKYYNGATYVINENSPKQNGVTLGGYININIREPYDKEEYEPNGKFTPTNSPLFMHEYGHYLQSQEMGWNYLFKVGIPSLMSAKESEKIFGNNIYNPYNIYTHDVSRYERDANRRAALYFQKYGVTWKEANFYNYPIGYPKFSNPYNFNYLYINSYYDPDFNPSGGRESTRESTRQSTMP